MDYVTAATHEKAVQKASEISGVDFTIVENLVRNVFAYQVTNATLKGQKINVPSFKIEEPFNKLIFKQLKKLAKIARPTVTIDLTKPYENN